MSHKLTGFLSGAGSMCMDRDGRPYVATRIGIQVFAGRSRGILP